MAKKKTQTPEAAEVIRVFTKKRGGSDTIREAGMKAVLIPLAIEEHLLLKQAAGISGETMNALARRTLMEAARKIVDNFKRT